MMSEPINLTKKTNIDAVQLLQGQSYRLDYFLLTKDGLYVRQMDKKTNEETYIKISEAVFVNQTVQNLDTKLVRFSLCYWFHNRLDEIEIGMGELIPNELMKLSAKGVDVAHDNVRLLSTFLREQQKLSPHKGIYHQVGWHKDSDGQLLYRHHNIIPHEANTIAVNDTENGTFNLMPKGTLKAWKEMIQAEVMNNLKLQLLLCIGFSAAIVGYLSRKYDDVDSLLIHLAGNSTQGKTTAALLAASIFGLPSNRNKGLQRTWNGTNNATINMMGGNYGVLVILDELSMSNAKSLTSMLYVLASGQEKYRLTEDIEQRETKTWGTSILSTGEKSIFELTNNNAGLRVRVLEFANVAWTTSAENADAIRETIQDNYGYAGIAFVEHIVGQGMEIMDETWRKWQEICLESLPDSPFRTRVAKKYAIILAAGDLANQSLGLSLDLEGVLSFLIEDEQEKIYARDIGLKAMDYITQLFVQHQMNFRTEGYFSNPINCWGKIFVQPNYIEVAFLKNVLEQQLRLGGFDDPRVIVREWNEKGWLVTEGDRATKRTKIFDKSEQADRKKALGTKSTPKKLQDTTYNIKLPLDDFKELLNQHQYPFGDNEYDDIL